MTSLKSDIRKAVPKDTLFKLVSESVKAAGDKYFRDFFFDSNKVLCYQRAEDSKPRVCVPAVCMEAVLRAAHGDSVLPDIPAWAERQQLWRTLTTGLDYLQMWRTLFVLVKHVLQPKVQIKSAWGQSPIQQCQFSHSPAGQWISLDLCLRRSWGTNGL